MRRRATDRSVGTKALRKFSICPFCTEFVLEQRKTEYRTT